MVHSDFEPWCHPPTPPHLVYVTELVHKLQNYIWQVKAKLNNTQGIFTVTQTWATLDGVYFLLFGAQNSLEVSHYECKPQNK